MKILERIKENDDKWKWKLFWASIVVIIFLIFIFRWAMTDNSEITESIIECITKNSTLYTSKTCGNCFEQEKELGEYVNHFNIIDCTGPEQSPTGYNECQMMRLISVPTWIIDGKKYMGVRKLNELKKLAGC